ncbi:CopD family protein [Thiothrix lacustris]|jgi:putative membrane protein|uniref:Protoporphyrinogen IX oxidase n=1 Tax=Thiothrix lacustris TaxID=525917 RepID=A0ABY9MPR1_9GAMM|nr:CopD family protein [Thiothrix lacustris]WML89836.1 CopD family protein [Thiothrix lacustris]WMP18565.1 CopD family protein [Thiothrix lacustris]
MYEWIKAIHVIFMVTWFAGLFYLPRLYVYHAMPENSGSFTLFKIMERRLFAIMTIGAGITLVFGLIMLAMNWQYLLVASHWFHLKLLLIVLLLGYHHACYKLMIKFRNDVNTHDHKWYRWFNEAPSVLLIVIVILAIVKPF